MVFGSRELSEAEAVMDGRRIHTKTQGWITDEQAVVPGSEYSRVCAVALLSIDFSETAVIADEYGKYDIT